MPAREYRSGRNEFGRLVVTGPAPTQEEEIAALQARVAKLESSLAVALGEMERWLLSGECDCDAEGHICGKKRLERSIATVKAAMKEEG